MSEEKTHVYVRPTGANRVEFARWAAVQEPKPEFVYPGWHVAVDLYPSVPNELLTGAVVDGHVYGHEAPQPEATSARVTADQTSDGTETAKTSKRASSRRTSGKAAPLKAERAASKDDGADTASKDDGSGDES